MARFVGIDYGKKRIGIAVTDPLRLICKPLKTVMHHEALPFLQSYIAQEDVGAIAIGMPLDLQGKHGEMAFLTKRFARLLHRHFPTIPLYYHDERFTSVIAQASLLETNIKKKQRQNKALLDAISASFILRSFLELYERGRSQRITYAEDPPSSVPIKEIQASIPA